MGIFNSNKPANAYFSSSKSSDKLVALAGVIEAFQTSIDFNEYDEINAEIQWEVIDGCVCPILKFAVKRHKDNHAITLKSE